MSSRRKWSKDRLLQVAVPAVPAIGCIAKLHIIWPPLGSIEAYAATLAVAIIAVFGVLPPKIATETSARAWAVGSALIAIMPLALYASLLVKYVKGVETPHNGTQYRTIGSQLTPLALQTYPGESPENILKQNGLTDGDIEKMWTPASVERARFELFLSYALALGLFNFARGSLAKAGGRPRAQPAKEKKQKSAQKRA
jgi:hypothetical protein